MAILDTNDWQRVDSTKRTEWRNWGTKLVASYQDSDVRTYTWACDSGVNPAVQNPESLQSASGWGCSYRGCQIQRGEPTGVYIEIWEKQGSVTFV